MTARRLPLVGDVTARRQPEYERVTEALDELEAKGMVVKNGMYRPVKEGVLEPVYVAVEYASNGGGARMANRN